MIFAKQLSVVYCMIFARVLFLILFEPRYSIKKTLALVIPFMILTAIPNTLLLLANGTDRMSRIFLVSGVLLGLIFFWSLSKYRDGRFFFTFIFSYVVLFWFMYLTMVIDYYLGSKGWFIVISRFIGCPFLIWWFYRNIRPILMKLEASLHTGWFVFTFISAMFYLLMTLSSSYPVQVIEHPEYLSESICILVITPAVYIHIFRTLYEQKNYLKARARDQVLQVQVHSLQSHIKEAETAEEKFRIERHDFRHKLQTIAALIEDEQYDRLRPLLRNYMQSLEETRIKRYTHHHILNAVLYTYLDKAENRGIRVNTQLHFPEELPVDEAELATVFANAIENAMNACVKTGVKEPFIDIKVRCEPCFMIQISNSYNGKLKLNADGDPIRLDATQGFGVRSIIAFCKKHDAYYEFKSNDRVFTLRIEP